MTIDPMKIRQQTAQPTVVHGDLTSGTVATPAVDAPKLCQTCGATLGSPGHENGHCSHP